ncbi:MAG TPA: DUF3305 domain-containing protein [Steroidobacteraceae bacterium]|nr:DUF3305 domain-containing protein [Steroidobacteraceae bacterium]
MNWAALARIRVGVIVERRKAESPWADFLYRPVSVLEGVPAASPWTQIDAAGDLTTYYAGDAVIELHRTETANYRENLASGAARLWVILRPGAGEVGLDLLCVTADPAEGEALTGAGNDLVESVPMPASIRQIVEDFIAEHHVEQAFFKRERAKSRLPTRHAGGSKDEA